MMAEAFIMSVLFKEKSGYTLVSRLLYSQLLNLLSSLHYVSAIFKNYYYFHCSYAQIQKPGSTKKQVSL